jgi:hypothetical protein
MKIVLSAAKMCFKCSVLAVDKKISTAKIYMNCIDLAVDKCASNYFYATVANSFW